MRGTASCRTLISILPVTVGLILVLLGGCKESGRQAASSEWQGIESSFAAAPAEHADPEACRECHARETALWEGSHHHLANAPWDAEDIERIKELDRQLREERGMEWRDLRHQPALKEGELPDYPLVGSIGLTPLVQHLLLAPDGRLQTHDLAWDTVKEEWFSVFDGEEGPPRVPGEWGHWTGQGMNWDANCAYCHMTEYAKGYDPATDRYQHEWTAMGITCAQCHPDMDVHLEQVRNNNQAFTEDLGPEAIMATCASCHSRREELTPQPFRLGDAFEDRYNLTLADVEGIYHPDGQVIGENYVYGSLMMSRMGEMGVTCMDCHDPHNHQTLLPVDNNALCMRCHGSGLKGATRIDPIAHSHHPGDSPGNQCVSCHMPVTHFMARDGRRDHSFSIPDPLLTRELGIPNACADCHTLESQAWMERHAEEWYGPEMNQRRRGRARLMQTLFAGHHVPSSRLREAVQQESNRFWRATYVAAYRYVAADEDDARFLESLLADPDPMVRAAAIRILGLASLSRAQAKSLLNDPSRLVRIAASLSSPRMAVASAEQEAELLAYLRHNADSPIGALRLAAYWTSRENPMKAVSQIQNAPDFEPRNPEAWRLAAIQLNQLGRNDLAKEYLQRALSLDPGQPEATFNLALLSHEMGETTAAQRLLTDLVNAHPSHARGWYNLVVLHLQSGDRATAHTTLRIALQDHPHDARLASLIRFVEQN